MTGRRVVRYVGGPLDGLELDVTESDEDLAEGAYQIIHGSEDRAEYTPDPGADPLVWWFRGMVSD